MASYREAVEEEWKKWTGLSTTCMITLLFGVSSRMRNVGEQGHMALLGHSLAAYISVLDRERLRKLTTRILSDTTLWLCRIFRYMQMLLCIGDMMIRQCFDSTVAYFKSL